MNEIVPTPALYLIVTICFLLSLACFVELGQRRPLCAGDEIAMRGLDGHYCLVRSK